jgi:dephospho-CoA kinase
LFWIALIELIVIIFLLYKLKSKKEINELTNLETKNIKDSKKNTIDMDNLMNSIHNSRTLYKELIKKCHPDRFINDNKQKNAEEIFQEITKNERNYEKLSSLKLRAENELNINF